MKQTRIIAVFYKNGCIDAVPYLHTIHSDQTKGNVLYDRNNFPLKTNETKLYISVYETLHNKHIGYEHIYFDKLRKIK